MLMMLTKKTLLGTLEGSQIPKGREIGKDLSSGGRWLREDWRGKRGLPRLRPKGLNRLSHRLDVGLEEIEK